MIESEDTFGTTTIYCDVIDCDKDEEFESPIDGIPDHEEAIEEAKENGWEIEKVEGEWEHMCPCCVENKA